MTRAADLAKLIAGGAVFNEASNDVDFRVESNDNANMLLVDAGNNRVGIGTSSPSSALHVDSSDDGPIFDSGGTGNTNHALLVRDSGNNQLLRVDNNGNTGVGTSSPSQALHVSASNPFFELQGTASTSGDTGIFLNANANHWILKADNYSSTNAFQIKQGDTSSSTAFMTINSIGAVTKPLQPAFCVQKSAQQANFSTGSFVDVVFDDERFDQNADFSSNTFTAPVTGRYQLGASIMFINVDTAANYYQVGISTSNHSYFWTYDPGGLSGDINYLQGEVNLIADMDANDTAKVVVYQNGGTAQTDISYDTDSVFSGFLFC
mgnify:CR=1 FL=1